MGWTIVFSPQALDDLRLVVRHVARDNPSAALRLGNKLIDRVSILSQFPWLGRPHPPRPGIRRIVAQPYIIFYRVNEPQGSIEILRYWHPARGSAPLGE